MTGRPRESLEAKFWRKVRKGKSPDDCWTWVASKFRDGYGQMSHSEHAGERRNIKAHRVSYEIHFGSIPDGMLVCHSCDKTECANPRHLFLGTWQDNVDDMIAKGRRADTSGELNGVAKLTRETVGRIRSDYALNDPTLGPRQRKAFSQSKLAIKYGVSQAVISAVIREETWKDRYEFS